MSKHSHRPLVCVPIDVRWGELDALGHVNNVVSFIYAETARVKWFESLGFMVSEKAAEGPVLVSASNNYLLPISYPNKLMIDLFLGKIGNSSFVLLHEIKSADENSLYSEGEVKCVWVNYDLITPRPVPELIRRLQDRT